VNTVTLPFPQFYSAEYQLCKCKALSSNTTVLPKKKKKPHMESSPCIREIGIPIRDVEFHLKDWQRKLSDNM
jgi:hypothetical protein